MCRDIQRGGAAGPGLVHRGLADQQQLHQGVAALVCNGQRVETAVGHGLVYSGLARVSSAAVPLRGGPVVCCARIRSGESPFFFGWVTAGSRFI